MMRVRVWWLAAVMGLLAVMLAACDDDAADEEAEDAPDEEAEDEEDEEDQNAPDEEAEVDTGDLELAEDGEMLVGSDLEFPPFEFIDDDGEPDGFDIDLMNEIADRLGVEVEFQDASFDTIFTQLASDEFDTIISAITITEERMETIDFTDPYFAANQALVVVEDSDIAGVDDLDGADVGAQAGTTGLDYATENFTESEIVEYDSYPAAFSALEGDQIDAVLGDLPVASEAAEDSDALDLVEEVDTGEEYGIGVQQGADNLRAAISDAIAEIIEDGTYEEIYTEWFEGEVPEQFRN
ncbi:basic amino acid ABC transporter substrate-binding protein [Egibacter rhizosphaerae]|nr:basic amino acid ABC transporter substrate-binding protein [Egibacter rhizosphaerae]